MHLFFCIMINIILKRNFLRIILDGYAYRLQTLLAGFIDYCQMTLNLLTGRNLEAIIVELVLENRIGVRSIHLTSICLQWGRRAFE